VSPGKHLCCDVSWVGNAGFMCGNHFIHGDGFAHGVVAD
jgi:hypothetical protein